MKKQLQTAGTNSLLEFSVKLKNTDTKKSHHVNKKTLQSVAQYLQEEHLNLIFRELSENTN